MSPETMASTSAVPAAPPPARRAAGPGLGPSRLDHARHIAKKYAKIIRITLIERFTYRGDFFLTTVLRFLPMLTTILLWHAVYTGSGQDQLSGFTLDQMIAYLLLVHISRMFSSMPGLAAGIARDVRDGTLKKYLLQPLSLIGYLLAYRVAHKTAYIATTALPYGLLFFLCRSYFTALPDGPTWAAYVLSLLLAFLVGFAFEACIGMVGFWFLEVTSLLYIVNTLNFFVSGHMFPLDLLPPFWAGLLKALPFQYLAYFPAAVFLGKIQGQDLVLGLLIEFAWGVAFLLLAHGLYRLGLRRYSAYGG
ncbi:MAG: ABC-2 family transporter protein [Gemmataceae bacterium]|nr:ABC-2 family transporter protein [Gemmataceae bacterium]MDW8266207.1 ABC-2 family transporter protein [Gemmataceae bacterium]